MAPMLLRLPAKRPLWKVADDGNPSYADWEWRVRADGDASAVTVTVDLHPVTFWRKYLLVKLRRPSLRKEMRSSLAALAAAVTH
jgi:hypothetical protein